MPGRPSGSTLEHVALSTTEYQEPETTPAEALGEMPNTRTFLLGRSADGRIVWQPADQPETPASRAATDHAAWIERVRAFRRSVQLFNEVVHQQRRRRSVPTLVAAAARPLPGNPEPEPVPTSPGQPEPASPPNGSSSPLTSRQQEVAGLIAQGKSNSAIAELLVLSAGTVANHVEHILNRLNFSNRAQVAAWAVQHGLVAQTPSDENGHAADRD